MDKPGPKSKKEKRCTYEQKISEVRKVLSLSCWICKCINKKEWRPKKGHNGRKRTSIIQSHFCQSRHILGVYVLARERVSGDDLLWQAQLSPQRSDFIFMEIFQWFDYFSLEDHKGVGSALPQRECEASASLLHSCAFLYKGWAKQQKHQIMYEHWTAYKEVNECVSAPLTGV